MFLRGVCKFVFCMCLGWVSVYGFVIVIFYQRLPHFPLIFFIFCTPFVNFSLNFVFDFERSLICINLKLFCFLKFFYFGFNGANNHQCTMRFCSRMFSFVIAGVYFFFSLSCCGCYFCVTLFCFVIFSFFFHICLLLVT